MRDYDDIYVGYKIKLHPAPEQIAIFDLYYRGSIYVYNYGIKLCEQAAVDTKYDYIVLSKFDLLSSVDSLIHQDGYEWLNKISVATLKHSMLDLNKANNNYMDKRARKPRWKYYDENHKQFSIREDRLQIYKDKIFVSSTRELPIGYVACDNPYDEIIGNGYKDSKMGMKYIHYYNSRIVYDGLDYYLSLSVQCSIEDNNTTNSMKNYSLNEDWIKTPIVDEAIGIDVGCKEDNWFVLSNGRRVHRPNTTKEERKARKLQSQMTRQQEINDKKYEEKMSKSAEYATTGEPLPKREKSNREKKTYEKFRNTHRRIVNRKEAVIHNLACDLVKMKPKAVIMEDLKVSDMLLKGNTQARYIKKHNDRILSACIFKSISIIKQKCENNGVLFIQAPSDYPSSQLCSNCGERIHIGAKRVFHCPNCGMKMDRDLNAAKTLENYFYENFEPMPFVTFGKVS